MYTPGARDGGEHGLSSESLMGWAPLPPVLTYRGGHPNRGDADVGCPHVLIFKSPPEGEAGDVEPP